MQCSYNGRSASKVIWLGDLNYRLSGSGGETRGLLERNKWWALLERDQLRAEQRAGNGWEEGEIWFKKYLAEPDTYAMAALSSSASHHWTRSARRHGI